MKSKAELARESLSALAEETTSLRLQVAGLSKGIGVYQNKVKNLRAKQSELQAALTRRNEWGQRQANVIHALLHALYDEHRAAWSHTPERIQTYDDFRTAWFTAYDSRRLQGADLPADTEAVVIGRHADV